MKFDYFSSLIVILYKFEHIWKNKVKFEKVKIPLLGLIKTYP